MVSNGNYYHHTSNYWTNGYVVRWNKIIFIH
jgi:hypothetical protein